jgi:hypothetical protein
MMTHQSFTAGRRKFYIPRDLKIIKTYFFGGLTNPSSSIPYLIETNDGLKGYSWDAYGPSGFHERIVFTLSILIN